MKSLKIIPVLLLLVLSACSAVRVNADYDRGTNFTQYKTYAFHKSGIDKVEISEFDKKESFVLLIRNWAAWEWQKAKRPVTS